jgi:hypothetical protein
LRLWCLPFHAVPVGFRVIFKKTTFSTCYDQITKVWFSCKLSSISANTSFWHAFFVIIQNFWYHLCTHFSHVWILCNNLVDHTCINVKFIGDHSNCQTSILMNESPYMVDVYACSYSQITVHLPSFPASLQSLCATEILEHVIKNHY